ncbi:SirB1 family protein [Stratiformator vulcanicus]|uniref:Protein SirB1 N-terminal domain-containing protein n=1 Tax=Stratiformator vulcanicus TaxID=2527980 RepID=A0A517QXQ2_9PLAN|nr:transglutaminase-like domain-containing protein [Stratiformator vulcanicus]QDT36368.1 hypothetical protein Pan189_07240 [Stratiformator vulcanicus]
MSLDPQQYVCDSEFIKLMSARRDVDLVAAALEIARDEDPHVDFERCYLWISDRAAELRGPVASADHECDALRELGKCLAGQHGLNGHATAFCDANGSLLHRVIETGRGLPISLSLIYIAVARHVGIDLEAVAAPGRFVTRYNGPCGRHYIDPFDGGRVLSEAQCVELLQQTSGATPEQIYRSLHPADPRTIVIRILNNLKAIHAEREEWNAAWRTQCRLVSLLPASYSERRDLALLSMRADRPGQAIDLLENCCKSAPAAEREMLGEQLKVARGLLCRWN